MVDRRPRERGRDCVVTCRPRTVVAVNLLDLVLVVLAASAALGGYRLGLLARGTSWLGLGVGLLASTFTVPWVLRLVPADEAPARLVIGVATLVFTTGFLASLGEAMGLRLRGALSRTALVPVDRGLGFVAGLFGVLALVWALLPAAAEVPGVVSQQVRSSTIVAWVRRVTPPPPDTVRHLRGLVDRSRFPEVFAELQPAPDTGPPPTELAIDPSVAATATPSTGNVESEGCGVVYEGSAFAVGPTTMVTNAHVVAGAERVTVVAADGRRLDANVVVFDDDRDLAVLDVPALDRPGLPLADAEVGAGAAVVGYPRGQDEPRTAPATIRDRREAVGRDIYGDDLTRREVLFLSAELQRGDSGAALIDGRGAVVGVVFAISPDRPTTAFAVDVSELRAVLDAPRRPGEAGRCQ